MAIDRFDDLKPVIQRVVSGETLSMDEASQAMDLIMTGVGTSAQIAALATSLRMRGETVEEIAGFARTMREHAVPVETDGSVPIVDTCGTGGDHAGTFNISTTAAFVIAGAGVPVAKHGNRSITSRCGSADVLEGLGVRIELGAQHVGRCIRDAGIGFMFAPAYHPGFRHAGAPRREIGIRTVFNILGPLTNPASVRRQLIGVGDPSLAPKLAQALALLGSERVVVVHSGEGLDEFGIGSPSHVTEYDAQREMVWSYEVDPARLGLERAPLETLQGGDVDKNVEILLSVLNGEAGPRRDVVVLNAAAGLHVAGRAPSIEGGIAIAQAAIDSGQARQALERLIAVSNTAEDGVD